MWSHLSYLYCECLSVCTEAEHFDQKTDGLKFSPHSNENDSMWKIMANRLYDVKNGLKPNSTVYHEFKFKAMLCQISRNF